MYRVRGRLSVRDSGTLSQPLGEFARHMDARRRRDFDRTAAREPTEQAAAGHFACVQHCRVGAQLTSHQGERFLHRSCTVSPNIHKLHILDLLMLGSLKLFARTDSQIQRP